MPKKKAENLKQLLKQEFQRLATKEDLKPLATKEELKSLAAKEDLKPLATKKDIEWLATMTQREFLQVNERLDRIENLFIKQHTIQIEDLQRRIKFIEDTFAINSKKR